jgi:hypothetical protein
MEMLMTYSIAALLLTASFPALAEPALEISVRRAF